MPPNFHISSEKSFAVIDVVAKRLHHNLMATKRKKKVKKSIHPFLLLLQKGSHRMTEPSDLGVCRQKCQFLGRYHIAFKLQRGKHHIDHQIDTFSTFPYFISPAKIRTFPPHSESTIKMEKWLYRSQPLFWISPSHACPANLQMAFGSLSFSLSFSLFLWSEIQRIKGPKWIKSTAGHAKPSSFFAAKRECPRKKRIARLPWKILLMRKWVLLLQEGSTMRRRGEAHAQLIAIAEIIP